MKPDLNLNEYAKHLETSSSNDSDDDFVPKKKQKTVSKQTATKVATPCFYNLANMSNTSYTKQNKIANKKNTRKNTNEVNKDNTMTDKNNTATESDIISYSDSILATHTVESVEKMNSISITETPGNYVVEYGDEDEERVVDVSTRIASGVTKVGVVDGEKVLINISPKSKPFPYQPVQPQQLTPAQKHQIEQASQYIRSQPKFVPPKNTQKVKSDNMPKKCVPSSSKPKRKLKSKFPARSDLAEWMNNSDSDFNG